MLVVAFGDGLVMAFDVVHLRPLWSLRVGVPASADWSSDGARLALTVQAGLVLDARDGTRVAERCFAAFEARTAAPLPISEPAADGICLP